MYRRNFIWNSIASVVNAAEAVFMSMIVTRLTGISDAGILAIAFAVGNLLAMVGKFGVRGFQVTDIRRDYSYKQYYKSRVITVMLMILSICFYACYKYFIADQSIYKVGCVVAICFIYCVEAFEDVLWGECQRDNRLDLGAKLFIARWSSIFAVFLVGLLISKNMLMTLWIALLVSLIVFCIGYKIQISHDEIKMSIKNEQISTGGFTDLIDLIKKCAPLFAMGFLYFYINNAPKYAIDACGMNELQAYYGFIAMPIFVIELLNGMIYQPSVVWLTEQWVEGNKDLFIRKVYKQFVTIFFIGILCVVGIALLGVPLLSIIYNVDLSDYWCDLILLQIAGIVLAMVGYLTVLLTITRQQTWMMIFYIIDAIFAFIFMKPMVSAHGIRGAVLIQICCLCILLVMKYARFRVVLEKNKKCDYK